LRDAHVAPGELLELEAIPPALAVATSGIAEEAAAEHVPADGSGTQ
jgi:hypothetical protein